MVPKFLETSGEGPGPQPESSPSPLYLLASELPLKGALQAVAKRFSALGADKTHPDGAVPLTSPEGHVTSLNLCLLGAKQEVPLSLLVANMPFLIIPVYQAFIASQTRC